MGWLNKTQHIGQTECEIIIHVYLFFSICYIELEEILLTHNTNLRILDELSDKGNISSNVLGSRMEARLSPYFFQYARQALLH